MFFCFLFSLNLQAQTVSLSMKDAPLEKVLSEIEKQTGFHFVYRWELIRDLPVIDLELRNVTLRAALDSCFKGRSLQYRIVDSTVVLSELPGKSRSAAGLIRVSGNISAADGTALEGATIKESSGRVVAITGKSGEFIIETIRPDAEIEVSYIGFANKILNIGNRNLIRISLELDVNSLEETIVKGYYSTSKRYATGTVGKLSAEQISKQPVSNPLAALQGRIPGLLVTQSNGMPGSDFSVLIRGRNSIQNGNEPLYIVDGVPFLSQRITQQSQMPTNNPFNTINPLDIESIEVLKDADATAIYGSRGANGVILITTKKGKQARNSVELTMTQGWGKITRFMDMLNTEQYRAMRYEALRNDGITPNTSNAYDLLVFDSTRYTDWKDLMIGGTAKATNINARINGGNENTRFSIGGSYYNETSVFPEKLGNERKTISVSMLQKAFDNRFNIQLNLNYSNDNNVLTSQSLVSYVANVPNAPALFDSLGRYVWSEKGRSVSNPLAEMLRKHKVATERITADAVLTYVLVKNLEVKANIGYNTYRMNERVIIPIVSQDPAYSPTGSSIFGNSRIKTWIVEPQIEYRINIQQRHHIQLLAGTTFQENFTERSLVRASGYTNDNLLNSTAGASSITGSAGSELYRYTALFARFNYQYQNRYIVNLTGRRDGSSRFGPGNQFANFGAAGIAWIFSEEVFIRKHLQFLSFGKLKASYGITGNDQIGDYQYLDTWSAAWYPYQNAAALMPTRISNPDYNWESNRKLEFSADLGFLKDRILVTVNWFRSKTHNPIVNYNLPSQTGFSSILKNFPGIVLNTGWEFELNTRNIHSKHFEWTSSINLTIPKNELESFPGLETSSYARTYRVGKPLNALIGFNYLGINQQTGTYMFEDINKDNLYDQLDYVYYGTTNPVFYGGVQNSLRFRNWTLDVMVQFVNQRAPNPVYRSAFPPGALGNQPDMVLNHWPANGAESGFQRYTTSFSDRPTFYMSTSSGMLTDASFVRLKNLALSYNLSIAQKNSPRLLNLKLFAQAQNLLTITQYVGSDPEANASSVLPPIAMATVGIQLTL
jgi:TonB-linked SusC/RagA family outer membrane protein